MASSMPPPPLGGFSLRVQLFSPDAHSLSDKPTRAFRVVISADATIEEFCEEAVRIHKINYGQPIAIKKCQDDQEFDVTQQEVVGNLFANMATIRVIQASATPGIRDSVPPNSALRYDPGLNINRKREREGSAQPNGDSHAHPTSNAWKSNKRQRVSELDPDQPIPSLEEDFEAGGVRQTRIVPESHGSNAFARSNGTTKDARAVIPESPPPEDLSTDRRSFKSPFAKLQEIIEEDTLREGSARSQSNPARAKSTSYHIPRATDRGTSVSTAATSPSYGHQQSANGSSSKRNVSGPMVNGTSRSPNEDSIYENIESDGEGSAAVLKKTKASLKIRSSRSPYNGLPGLEWANNRYNTPPNGTRRNSRPREEPTAELPAPKSREREEQRQRKEADEARKAREAAAEAAEQRKRDAEAAEIEGARRVEAERVYREEAERDAKAEQARIIEKAARLEAERQERERVRLEKLENDRLEKERKAEESRREQARLKKEKEEKAGIEREKRAKSEEARRDEAERMERKNAERAGLLREQQEQERAAKEAADAEGEELEREKGYAEAKRRKSSSASAGAASSQATPPTTQTPIQPPIRPQSSTPFIPTGRKSSLKSSNLSQPGSSPVLSRSSPSGSSTDVQAAIDGGKRRVSFNLNGKQDTPIRPGTIRPGDTLPGSTKATPKENPKATSRTSTPKAPVSSQAGPSKPAVDTPVRPITRVVPPPSLAARLFKDRSSTPQQKPTPQRAESSQSTTSMKPQSSTPKQTTTLTPSQSAQATSVIRPPTRATPQVVIKSSSPAIPLQVWKSVTPSKSASSKAGSSKEKSKSVEPAIVPQLRKSETPSRAGSSKSKSAEPVDTVVISDDDSEEDIPNKNRIDSLQLLNNALRTKPSPAPVKAEPKIEEEPVFEEQDNPEDDDYEEPDVEMASNGSSSRESRSPVIFNQKNSSSIPDLAPFPAAANFFDDEATQSANESDSESGEEEDDEDEDEEMAEAPEPEFSEDEDEDESESADEAPPTKPTVQVPKSSRELSRSKPAPTPAAAKSSPAASKPTIQSQNSRGQKRKPAPTPSSSRSSDSGSERNTQDEVDNQLTSSMFEARPSLPSSQPVKSSPVPPPTSQFRHGASLQSMNEHKPQFTPINGTKPMLGVKEKEKAKVLLDEEEEDSDESDESDESDDSDSEEEIAKTRNELAAKINKLGSQSSSQSTARVTNGSASKSASLSRQAGKELREKKKDKYLSKYQFSQPA